MPGEIEEYHVEETADGVRGVGESSAERIASIALATFASLPKTGKPQPHEHTALAAITITLPDHASRILGTQGPLVIALATGTKCIPGSKRRADGSTLHDCHAEVLARRAAVRWMFDELETSAPFVNKLPNKNDDVLSDMIQNVEKSSCWSSLVIGPDRKLLPGVKLEMFVSHAPCGDAAIVVGADGSGGRTGAKPVVAGLTSHLPPPCDHNPCPKRPKFNTTKSSISGGGGGGGDSTCNLEPHANDFFSKEKTSVLPTARDVESGADPQATGIVRRKPGRGDPTFSVSCSDKMARWGLLGLQGALLGGLMASTPVYLERIVVGVDASQRSDEPMVGMSSVVAALQRALVERSQSVTSRLDAGPGPLSFRSRPLLNVAAVHLAEADAHALGLTATPIRHVACGISIAWWAPPSVSWRLKPCKQSGVSEASPELLTAFRQHAPQYIVGGRHECVTGKYGTKHGTPPPPSLPEVPVPHGSQSMLCRASLVQRYGEVARSVSVGSVLRGSGGGSHLIKEDQTSAVGQGYAGLKKNAWEEYAEAWKLLVAPPSPFEGWIAKPPTCCTCFAGSPGVRSL